MFELYTRLGTKIVWGYAGGGAAAEPSAEEKIARLQQYAAAHSGLDGGQPLDVRSLPAVRVAKQ
jgi:hypothetical protein